MATSPDYFNGKILLFLFLTKIFVGFHNEAGKIPVSFFTFPQKSSSFALTLCLEPVTIL